MSIKTVLFILLLFLPFLSVIQAQTVSVTVQGTVVDPNGDPIGGALVQEENTDNGTVTNGQGHFQLEVKSGSVLSASFMGYKTKTFTAEAGKALKVHRSTPTRRICSRRGGNYRHGY